VSTIGNINVKVGANISDLSKGLGTAEKEVGGFGGSIASLASKGGALAGGFLGVTAVLGKLGEGIKGAADMEQAEIGFGVLFKSTDTAKAVLGDLSKFAAETPFELPELTAGARSLAAFGFSAESIVPNMRMLGDIASGTNQPIGELAELYGKARVQGRLFGEDINQLTGRGIPVIQALAKQFGVAESGVKKLVENGKVGFPELEKALQSMTNEGGMFSGLMAQQSQSLTGLWSTMNDSIGGALRDIAGKIMAALNIKDGIASFTTGIDTVKDLILSTGPFWEQALNNAKAIIDSMSSGFQMMGEGFSAVLGFMGTNSSETVTSIGQGWMDLMIAQEWAWNNMGNIAAFAWEGMKLTAVTFFEDLKHQMTVVLPAIWSWLSDDWGATWRTMLDYTLTILTNLGQNIRNAMAEIWDWIASGGTNAMEFAWTPLTDGAVSAMKKLPDIPERAMTELEKSLTESTANLGDSLWTSLGEHMDKRTNELGGPGGFKVSGAPAVPALTPPAATSMSPTKAASEAPKLAGAFVKGSIEEASLRNKIEAGPEFKQMVTLQKQALDESKKQTELLRDNSKKMKPAPPVGVA
jgi:tape measure domain-containing protein